GGRGRWRRFARRTRSRPLGATARAGPRRGRRVRRTGHAGARLRGPGGDEGPRSQRRRGRGCARERGERASSACVGEPRVRASAPERPRSRAPPPDPDGARRAERRRTARGSEVSSPLVGATLTIALATATASALAQAPEALGAEALFEEGRAL